MNRLDFVRLASAAFLSMPAAAQPADTDAARQFEKTAARIDRFATSTMDELDLVPGLSLAVIKDGEIVHLAGYGWADIERRERATPDTIYYTASLSKALTGMGASLLAAGERLDLDAPIVRFFPGLEFSPPLAGAEATSVRDLLTHTAPFINGGINFYTTFVGRYETEDLVRVLSEHSEPSEGFVYSNTNYALVSEILERAGGKAWQDVLASEVFDPVGMGATTAYASRLPIRGVARPYMRTQDGFEAQPPLKTDGKITGAGGFFSTARDLAHYVSVNLNGGRLEGRQVLPEAAVREAQRPQVELSDRFFEFSRRAYGLGLYIADYEGETLIHHFGGIPGGFRSHMSFMPEHGTGVVVLQNTAVAAAAFPDIVAAYVYDLLLERSDADERARRRVEELAEEAPERLKSLAARTARMRTVAAEGHVPALSPRAYLGRYRNPRLGTVHVRPGSDGLRVQWGEIDAPLVPLGGHDFLVQWQPGYQPATWTFQLSGDRLEGFDWGGRPFRRLPAPSR